MTNLRDLLTLHISQCGWGSGHSRDLPADGRCRAGTDVASALRYRFQYSAQDRNSSLRSLLRAMQASTLYRWR